MKRVAIIAPCILPVPASKGGAVEGLITRILDDNELNKNFSVDLFTIADGMSGNQGYSYTNIVRVESNRKIGIEDRITDKYYRTVSGSSSNRLLDKEISSKFIDRISEAEIKYDAVIIENMMSTACEIVQLCEGRFDFPIFFHMHNDVDIYRSPKQIRELVRFGVRFLATSGYIKDQIIKCDKNAVVSILYNGIDLTRYHRKNISHKDERTFLYTGRIIPGKGVKELIQAFLEAFGKTDTPEKDRIKLEIVGFSGFDRGYENSIRRMVESNCNISCHEQIPADEMPALYDSADIVVMPSLVEESFGLVALETMAMGIPLIVSNSGALPEVVEDGAAIVDNSKDFVGNLSEEMKRLALDDGYRKELSEKGYNRAHSVKDFDINNYYNNFVELISEDRITSEDVISVIVPVYNVSSYLKRCVDSLVHQSYDNLEIILVDDGSTDDSASICDEYASCDTRIRVIHQENIGLSGARNIGLDKATGRFVFFCDSDDFLRMDALEKMLKQLKRDHSDVVACGIDPVYDEGGKHTEETGFSTDTKPGRWSGPESVVQMMRGSNVCSVAWNKLYKRILFDGIRFPLNIQNEDEATTYKILYRAKMVSFIPDKLYKYYQRDDSIIHQELNDRYRFFVDAAIDRITFFHELGEDELEQHSRISLLEWIKYSYRNIEGKEKKYELLGVYRDNVNYLNAPVVLGMKKKMALLLWKYIRY